VLDFGTFGSSQKYEERAVSDRQCRRIIPLRITEFPVKDCFYRSLAPKGGAKSIRSRRTLHGQRPLGGYAVQEGGNRAQRRQGEKMRDRHRLHLKRYADKLATAFYDGASAAVSLFRFFAIADYRCAARRNY